MTSVDLIREAVAVRLLFKIIANILKSRPSDPLAAEALIAAFERGDAPAWLTAYFLGCLRARAGYFTVRDILVAAPGLLAESYAGVAMHTILDQEAFADLAHLIVEGSKLRTREGSAYGLGQFNSAAAAQIVFSAAVAGKIRPNTAGGIVARLPFDDERVAELLLSTDERTQRIGIEGSSGLKWVLARSEGVVTALRGRVGWPRARGGSRATLEFTADTELGRATLEGHATISGSGGRKWVFAPIEGAVTALPDSVGQAAGLLASYNGRDERSNFANREVRRGILVDGRPNCAFCEVEPPRRKG